MVSKAPMVKRILYSVIPNSFSRENNSDTGFPQILKFTICNFEYISPFYTISQFETVRQNVFPEKVSSEINT